MPYSAKYGMWAEEPGCSAEGLERLQGAGAEHICLRGHISVERRGLPRQEACRAGLEQLVVLASKSCWGVKTLNILHLWFLNIF